MVVVVLVAVLTLQWLGWSPEAIAPEPQPTPTTAASLEGAASVEPELLAKLDAGEPKDSYASVVEHPLFRPDRLPEPPEDEEPEVDTTAESSQELDAVDLSAVLISPTVVSAWVRDPSQPKLQRLRIGDELMGWSVQSILEDRVLLERQGERDELILRDYSKTPPAAPPAAARTPARRRPPRPPRAAAPPEK
nr:hypothetical protein [Thiorhodococcus minor]